MRAGVIGGAVGLTGMTAGGPLSGATGYEMPLESAPHERTFMQWPTSLDVYDRPALRGVQHAIARIANSIVAFEPVVMMASTDQTASARALLSGDVEVWNIPTDDLWCRDSGPTFVKNPAGALAIAHLRFNGWGNKQPHRNDAMIVPRLAERLGIPLLPTGLIGEQGGVEHDGAGTLLAHASSWVNRNRNAGTSKNIGRRLLQALGGRKMIWAPGIRGDDITDFHIDAIARFISPGQVLIQLPAVFDGADPWSRSSYQTYEILKQQTDANGQHFDIIVITDPTDVRSTSEDFVSSYANYYVCNGAVISTQFGDRNADTKAGELLKSLYPGREVISLDVDALGEAGGGIHCATQQQPKAGRA